MTDSILALKVAKVDKDNSIPSNWSVVKLGDIATRVQNGIYKASEFYGEGYLFIRMYNIQNESWFLNLEKLTRVKLTDQEFHTYRLEIDDILVSRVNSLELIGKTAWVDDQAVGYVYENMLIRLRLKPVAHSLFVAQQMNSRYVRTQITSMAKRASGQVSISSGDLRNINIYLPPLSEQKKISKTINSWDRAIDLISQLIAAKQQRRRGLMQQLLTGKQRFREFEDEVWPILELGDFLIRKERKVSKPPTNYLPLGVRSHGKGTFVKEEMDPEDTEMTELYKVQRDDLIVNITFAWEGAIAIVRLEDEACLVSHRFPTYEFNRQKVIPEFFRYLMLTKRFFFELGLISPGGAGRNRVLNKSDFLRLKVSIPSLPEQRRIAEVLQACDSEIELLEQKRDLLKQQKQGLMQQLLTGRVRVSVDPAEV